MEIERKFLVKQLPDKLYEYDNQNINQYYISYEPEVRIRTQDYKRFLTIKSTGDLIRKEVEIEISKIEYEKLKELSMSNPIFKTRFIIPKSDYVFELDIYHNIPGLITVEVEFKTEQDADNFIVPEWFGDEITYIKEFKNKNLAKNGFPKELKCYYCKGTGSVAVDYSGGLNTLEDCEICNRTGRIDIKNITDLNLLNEYLKRL